MSLLGVGAVLSAPYWLGPLVVYGTQKVPLAMQLRPSQTDELSVYKPSFARLEEAATQLAKAGFSAPAWFRSSEGAVAGIGGLLEHPGDGTLATIAVLAAEHVAPRLMVILESEWGDGYGVLTANAANASAFPQLPRRDGMTLPRVQDAAVLHQIHLARCKRVRPRHAPTRLTRGADPVAAERERTGQNRLRHVKIGYYRRVGDHVRPTIRGAALMTWRLLPPWKNSQLRERDRREAALLQELGISA